ncbi:MAG: DUF5309 family protein [Planctomycetota bacterium]
MPFTGKATYSAGSSLPEMAEDVSDVIGIVSPYETPLLDHLGDPQRVATGTVHEWLEDALRQNQSKINDPGADGSTSATSIVVTDDSLFRAGDLIQQEGSREVMLATSVDGTSITVVRGYGGTTAEALADDEILRVIGNAALEGQDADTARWTNRTRQQNYTQIFSATIEVSGSQLAATQAAVADEMDYQKQERLRELLRELENSVINGVAAASDPQGSASTRRSMRGILASCTTNTTDAGAASLSEASLNAALRGIWDRSSGNVDTIVVNGFQKRAINQFIASSRGYASGESKYSDLVSVYESDFGVCRVLLSRWVPADTVMLLDSSRIDVLPLQGRNFAYRELASAGDKRCGQVVGEYTLEVRNESAHGVIRNLATS